MSQLTLTDIKRHCQALDFDHDDALLQGLWGVAEEFVQNYTRRNLDAEFPEAWPESCIGAVKMLVALWYENRAAAGSEAQTEVPFSIRDLLAAYRSLA